MEYANEHLLPGQIGHLCVLLSFVAALLSTVSYFFATQYRQRAEYESWRNLGRFSFLLHGLATFSVIATLFVILTGKMYEYQYAWANISDDLPQRYVFSAFWKEQQGSFLLWSFWHIVLSLIIMLRGGKWETPVMTVIALAEVFISCMMLGLYFGDFRFGASPFDLLRDVMDAPIFAQANYLEKIKGNGLNPLLQNYWMTIHPPTLFLGFASTVVPFGFAIAGLWLREHREWLKPALQWALFSAGILGTGILMGGAWAYEALSFAGYWAWDPVENTSLVPWLTLVAGLHTNLIARATGYSIRSTYAFYLITFILVLYSTYLTRSGILGDTSAHAFTEMGLGIQLIAFMVAFAALGKGLWFWRYREIPEMKAEESASSREFWMFIGSLVLLFSSILITGATSLPVVNKIFGTDYALRDPMEHHNRYQLWIAVFMGLLTGVGQYMRFSEKNWAQYKKAFVKFMLISMVGAFILTMLNRLWIDINAWQVYTMLFAGMFAVVSNAAYIISVLRGNLKLAASAISHVGFGVLVLGILSTGLGKTWISANSFAMEGLIEGADGEALGENVILMKNAPMPIKNKLTATYVSDTLERQTRTFAVQFQARDTAGNATGEAFLLHPNVMYDRQFSKIVASNPSTMHYWNYDIFTHVSSLPKAELDKEFAQQQEDSLKYKPYEVKVGDTVRLKDHLVVVEEFTKVPVNPEYKPERGDLALGIKVRALKNGEAKTYSATPMIYLRPGAGGFGVTAPINELQLKLRLPESALDRMFKLEEQLQYTTFQVQEGGSFEYKGYVVQFAEAIKNIKHPMYAPEPNDIGIAAGLNVLAPDGRTGRAEPVFLIRNNSPFILKDEISAFGLHFRFDHIDPNKGLLSIAVAQTPANAQGLPLEIAEDIPRSDYIVLEAIIFPGINLVWAGSILMLIGLFVGMTRRLSSKTG